MKRTWFLLVSLLILLCLQLSAQQTAQRLVQETRYLLSLPEGYGLDTATRWPLLIFLHGSGESGLDLEKVKAHGPPELLAKGKKLPFVVVSPQADQAGEWDVENLYRLLKYIKKTERVDPDRVYLTGLSMGGEGCWALAMKHPDVFAAIAPVCGRGDTTDTWKLRNIPIWCFHGAKDKTVLPINSERLVTAASHYNPAVRFTLYPEADHNSWDLTYNNDSLYDWFLAHSRFRYHEITLEPTVLKQYAGRYASDDKDTLTIAVDSNMLVIKAPNRTVPLRPAAPDLFFLQPTISADLKFIRRKGVVSGILIMANDKTIFRKLK